MAELSDEILMAFADGELTPTESAHVKIVVDRDPAARARLDVFEATRAPLGELSHAAIREPVPRHLVELVRTFPIASADAKTAAVRHTGKTRFSTPPRQSAAGWYGAVAYSTALLIGLGGGWYLHEATPGTPRPVAQSRLLVTPGDGRIVAAGALHAALETLPGGVRTAAGTEEPSGAAIETRLTFKSKQGFCRQYEFALQDRTSFAGIGCRGSDGLWLIQSHFPVQPRSANESRIGAAAAREVLVAIVGSISEGDALDAPAEETLIQRKWKD